MRINRDSLALILATAAVVLVIALGFWKTRGPGTQRLVRADEKRIQNLSQLANEINAHYRSHDKQLPSTLSDVQRAQYLDPLTTQPFAYNPKPPNRYSLCATFATVGPMDDRSHEFIFWSHGGGLKCFEFSANEGVPQPPYFY